MPTQTQTKTRTNVTTGILIMAAAGVGLAAGIAYLSFSPTKTLDYKPGMFNLQGVKVPGYTTPGYTATGLACYKNGFETAAYSGTLGALPKSSFIKAEGLAAVYWYGKDGKRYVFTDLKTYNSWYVGTSNCPTIREVPLSLMVQIPIAGVVYYRPVVSLIKITTDPKVYAIEKGGILHWVESEALISQIVKPNWKTVVKDIPDAFFVNYKLGTSIKSMTEWTTVMKPSAGVGIDEALGL